MTSDESSEMYEYIYVYYVICDSHRMFIYTNKFIVMISYISYI